MKPEIINCLTWFANTVSQTVHYDNWSDELARREVADTYNKFINEVKKHIDFNDLTVKEALTLRFGKWDEESGLYLIPLYLLPALPVGIELTSIMGDKIIYDGSNIDNDTRFGCIAWGIVIEEKKNENS